MPTIAHIASYKGNWDFDLVIVGSGPSGAMVARTMAENGKRILVLEYGPIVSPGTNHQVHQRPFSKAYSQNGKLDADPWTACCIGGGMQFYDAITFRYKEVDLAPSKFLSSDMLMDWPISLSELQPHYDKIEKLLKVTGTNCYPQYPISSRAKILSQAMTKLGISSKSTPLAITPPEAHGGCIECSACDERSCPIEAKASVLSRGLLEDEDLHGSITILYGCLVKSINEGKAGSVDSINCFVPFSGEMKKIPVNQLIVCANAIQSAAIFLRSKTNFSPMGIGNNRDLVGRGLMFKISGYSTGYWNEYKSKPALTTPFRGVHSTLYSDEYYTHDEVPSGMGGLIYEANFSDSVDNIGNIRLHYIAGEEPWSKNRIVLDSSADKHGIPYIKFIYENTLMDYARINFLARKSEDILQAAGADYIEREPFGHAKGSSHLHGTMRAGKADCNSVVDVCGKVHGYDNVYVMDGSVMNFAGNSNPTHTIMANARRMAMTLNL